MCGWGWPEMFRGGYKLMNGGAGTSRCGPICNRRCCVLVSATLLLFVTSLSYCGFPALGTPVLFSAEVYEGDHLASQSWTRLQGASILKWEGTAGKRQTLRSRTYGLCWRRSKLRIQPGYSVRRHPLCAALSVHVRRCGRAQAVHRRLYA
jgi:hypothetical protein